MIRYSFIALLLAAAVSLFAGSGAAEELPRFDLSEVLNALDDDLTAPAAWGGIWETETTIRTCTGTLLDGPTTTTDTLCTGASVNPDNPEDFTEITCTGTVSDTQVDVTCTGSIPIPEIDDCMALLTMDYDATRTGESYTAVVEMTIEYDGTGEGCEFLPAQCTRVEITGTRVGAEPPNCLTPVETSSWGLLKNRYRD